MLNNPTLDKLKTLRLIGMANALKDQEHVDEIASLSFHERLGLMIDREMLELRKPQARDQA